MDFSRHSVLATRFATLALVFSVSACVLSHSMAENEKMDTQTSTTQASAKEDQKSTSDAKAVAKQGKEPKQAKAEPMKSNAQKALKTANAATPKIEPKKKVGKTEEKQVVKQPIRVVDKKVVRYVSVETLNVRAHASMDAPVVGKLTLGTMYHVTVEGPWARIGDNQWVMTRYLSTQPPRRGTSSWTMRK